MLGTRYVFKVKDDIARTFKSRMVIFLEQPDRDYDIYKISSGVAGSDSGRVLLALAHKRNFHLSVQDISQAFLNARRDEDRPVYIRIRPGMKEFYQGSGDISKCLCQVVRSVYGLKEAPRLWQEEFTKCDLGR